jgi:hypothetical protein
MGTEQGAVAPGILLPQNASKIQNSYGIRQANQSVISGVTIRKIENHQGLE